MQESVTPATESDKNFEEFKNLSELAVDESVTCAALRRNEMVGQCSYIFSSDTMTLVWLNVGWFKSGSFLYPCALLSSILSDFLNRYWAVCREWRSLRKKVACNLTSQPFPQ